MSEEVRLVIPKFTREKKKSEMGLEEMLKTGLVASIKEISNWFSDFEITEIDITLEAGVKTGNVVNLIVSTEGKGGITIKLQPKKG